jgi:dihydroorotate dehydrogenase electron transfer subunit
LSEPRTLAPPERRVAVVSGVERLGAYELVTAVDPSGPPNPRPGQFYMLAAEERWGGSGDERPYLPRAFSYARARGESSARDARAEGGGARSRGGGGARSRGGGIALSFLLEAVGPGTDRLAELVPDEGLALVGPLGVGFRPPVEGTRPLLVGGGIGAAPLLCWQEELLARRQSRDAAPEGAAAPQSAPAAARPEVLLGFRSADHAQAAALFAGRPQVVTDDGSVGRQALVTEVLATELDRDPRATVYACGPPAMLEAVRALCAERDVPAQLAMESGMACGFGACFGCVVPTRNGYARLCVDGPVLDAEELETALVAGAGH